MEYDKRIIYPNDNIWTPFGSTAEQEICVGLEGYFTDCYYDFEDLDNCREGTLICINWDSAFPFEARVNKGKNTGKFTFFLPARDVKPKEKKWRPFTLDEFLKRFPLLSSVTLRTKSGDLYTLCVTGHGVEKETQIEYVILGGRCYDFKELLNKYDLQDKDGNWTLFGVEE